MMFAVKASAAYGFIAVGALAILSLVQWFRSASGASNLAVGIVPNFAAPIAIIYVILGIAADQKRKHWTHDIAGRWAIAASLVAGGGLIAWEFAQLRGRLVFDPWDIAATLAGVGASALIFSAVNSRVIGR